MARPAAQAGFFSRNSAAAPDTLNMSAFGPGSIPPVSVTQVAGGLGQSTSVQPLSARQAERQRAGIPVKRTRTEDEVELQSTTVETDVAIRDLGQSGGEEAHEERQKQNNYQPQKGPDRPRIDVQG